MREATKQITKDCSALMENEIPEEKQEAIFANKNLTTLNSSNINRMTSTSKPFSINVSEIKYNEPMANISFSKPLNQVDIVKEKMGVRTNKDVGIKAFDYYFKRECEEDE